MADGLESAISRATVADGDRAVTVVGGVNVIRQLLRAGLVDELRIDIVPVMLGGGMRQFDDDALKPVRLEKVRVDEIGARTSLRFPAIQSQSPDPVSRAIT